jgi:hypothetical protein
MIDQFFTEIEEGPDRNWQDNDYEMLLAEDRMELKLNY